MKPFAVALLAWTITLVAASAEEPYGANRALNPVTFHNAPQHEPLKLIEKGKLNFAIAFDHSAETDKKLHTRRRSVRNAAKALQEAIKKCTDLDAPVIDANAEEQAKAYRYLILVGKSPLTDKLGMKPLALPPDGFEVRTFPGGVAIAGHDGSLRPEGYHKLDSSLLQHNGTCHGVHDFIERFLGVRFYFPGPGVVWPKVTDLTLRPVRYTDAPVFHNRMYYTFNTKRKMDFGDTRKVGDAKKDEQWPAAWADYPEDWREFRPRWRLGYGSPFSVSHCPPPEKWLAAHPDKKEMMFYRDPSGAQYYEEREHLGNYYDVSNLALADLYVADCKRFYETGWDDPWQGWRPPNSKYIFFGQCDTFVSNMSTPTIRKLGLIPESRRGSRDGELSDVYARFHIALGEKIKQELPGKRLGIMPYQNYALPPVNPKYRTFPDNVDLQVCIGDFCKYIKNPEKIAFWRDRLTDWYEVLGQRPVGALWLYNTYRFPWGKAVISRHIGDIPRMMGKYLGRGCLFFDGGMLEWYHYPAWYCAYRAMWNPDFDVEAALHEHWPLLYGKAAPYLEEFDKILVDRWIKVFALKGITTDVYKEALPLPLLDKLEDLLKKAEAALEPGSVEMLRFKLYAAPWPEAIKRMRGSILFKKPIYKVKRMEQGESVTVDGKVDEPVWQRATVVPLQDPYGSGQKRDAFTGRMVWNDTGLYVSFAMAGKPLADANRGPFKNDNVEMFFAPGTELNNYFQFMVNAAGAVWTGMRTLKPVPTPYDSHWKCSGFRHAVDVRDDGWSFEMFVPFDALEQKPPGPYANWFLNIVGNKLSKPAEYSAFSLTQGNNHNVELFGYLHFLGRGD